MKHKPIEKHKLELKELNKESRSGFQKICCPSCDGDIAVSDLNINDKIGKCGNCNVVFSFKNDIKSLLNTKPIKQEIIRPEGIDIFYFKDDLDITIEQPYTVFEIVASILLFFFTFFTTLIYFIPKGEPLAFSWVAVSWFFFLYPVYLMLFHKNHKLHITIDDKFLSIIRRPKKMIKDKHFEIRDIDQVYIARTDGFVLKLITNTPAGQKHVTLIPRITSISKARFLEQEIEKYLGIEDREVPEEIK